jgi:3-oxoacyl-[acyl-carrier protein] reductase
MTPVLEGCSVIVTGAGDGVGRGIAIACAAAGAHVIAATRRDNGLDVVRAIEARGGSAEWVRCDVSAAETVAAAVSAAVARTGGLDAMIHNATSNRSSEPHRVEHVTPQLFDEHAAVSLLGAYNCARAAFSALRARGGTLMLMTSPAGVEGSATLPLYATMKGALRGFTKSLAREWAPFGVTVNILSPLAYSPAMVNAIRDDPAMDERLKRRVPLGRVGDAETDVGPVVAFLAGPAARYMTGQTIGIDGGHFMSL